MSKTNQQNKSQYSRKIKSSKNKNKDKICLNSQNSK